MRIRILLFIMAVALLVAACSSTSETGDTAPGTSVDATTSSVQDDQASSQDSTSTTAASEEGNQSSSTQAPSSPKPEGPAAPDFTLALGESGAEVFNLSQEVKPVFMVFWAEW